MPASKPVIKQGDLKYHARIDGHKPHFIFKQDPYYFLMTEMDAGKIEYMLANPQVCFELEQDVQIVPHEEQACKWGQAYTSVIGFGTVREITETPHKAEALNHIMRHYSGKDWEFDPHELARTRVWCITVEQVTGKHREAK
jgi:nitroimidazol reductase NimA-like FMN-containing flavoprotein (pyridoxamine 5'-phosphate oxidase superfamily)